MGIEALINPPYPPFFKVGNKKLKKITNSGS